MLLFNIIKNIYSLCLVSAVHSAYFNLSFGWGLRGVEVFGTAFIGELNVSGQSCLKIPLPQGCFLA